MLRKKKRGRSKKDRPSIFAATRRSPLLRRRGAAAQVGTRCFPRSLLGLLLPSDNDSPHWSMSGGGRREEIIWPHSRFLPHRGTVQHHEAIARGNQENVARSRKGALSVSICALPWRQPLERVGPRRCATESGPRGPRIGVCEESPGLGSAATSPMGSPVPPAPADTLALFLQLLFIRLQGPAEALLPGLKHIPALAPGLNPEAKEG